MKTKYCLITIIALFFTFNAFAQRYRHAKQDWGVGIRLGQPTALSIKKYIPKSCMEFNIGVNPGGGLQIFGISGQVNYIMQRNLNFNEIPELDWYWGTGATIGFSEGRYVLGPDALAGVEYNIKNIKKYPYALFVDFGLLLNLLEVEYFPDLKFIVGIGVRYNFY